MGRVCSTCGEKWNAYRALVGKSEENRPLRTPRRRWGIILKCIEEIGWGGMDWINLALDTDQWLDLVKTVMNLQVE
jgi:hypothetical protein